MIQDGMIRFHEGLEPLLMDIDEVLPHPENYNAGDVELIMDSIMASGMYRPIYVQKETGLVVAGNHTWMACKELGATRIPVVQLEIDDLTAKRLMVADNEIARKARRDDGLLVKILSELQENDTLLGTGISDNELMQLKALAEVPLDVDESQHKMWPTVCFTVPPHVKKAFYDMTEMAGGDRERFELILRLAGWNGKQQ